MLRSTLRVLPRRSRYGFTLVELLVVIGIIALLISILLPSLNRAREAAKRTQCLSNLRSIGQMLNMYANQNRGFIPVGYRGGGGGNGTGVFGSNYYLGSRTSKGTAFFGLGLLYPAGFISTSEAEGQIFYCPSTGDDTDHSFNTNKNPWMSVYVNGTGSGSTRAGYSCRSSDPTSDRAVGQRGIMWPTAPGFTFLANPYAPVNGEASNNPKLPATMMKLSRLKTKAIVSDLNIATRVKVAHKKGINVLLADGSAKYLDISYIGNSPTGPITNPENYTGPVDPTRFLQDDMTVAQNDSKNRHIELWWGRVDAAP